MGWWGGSFAALGAVGEGVLVWGGGLGWGLGLGLQQREGPWYVCCSFACPCMSCAVGRQAAGTVASSGHACWQQKAIALDWPSAICLPTPPFAGYADRELLIECSTARLLVQSEDSPPLIDRILAYGIDSGRPIESFK